MQTQWPLFVFGTLRRGHENHHYLAGHYVSQEPALLRSFRRIRPLMIARDSHSSVEGELYTLEPGHYDATLRQCDELEGIPEGALAGPDYRRLLVEVETAGGPRLTWAYVHPETTDQPEG